MPSLDALAGVDRLGSLDAGFLALESPRTPMHIGSITYLDGDPLRDHRGRLRLDDLRGLVEERLALVPRFRQRPVTGPLGLGRPVWIDDPAFDVATHVNEIVLPSPGSEDQLRDLCCHLMMRVLERSRPLWELWFVDGGEGGGVALIEKVHHVMMDGVSGIDVAMVLTDATPEVGSYQSANGARPAPPRPATLFATGLIDEFGHPLSALRTPASVLGRLVSGAPGRGAGLLDRVGPLGRGVVSLLRPGTFTAPSSLNQPVGAHRRYSHVEVPLDAARSVARAFGGTLNDVVLALVTGGIRALFLERGDDLSRRFQVAVPVSTRGAAEHAALGNRVAVLLVPLPLDEPDGRVRLARLAATTRQRKAAGQAAAVAGLVSLADRLPSPIVDVVAGLVHRQSFANAVVTNVPGPREPRYLLGARIRAMAPLVPLAANLDLSVGVLSYDRQLCFGCFADAERCGDLAVLEEGIGQTMEELDTATRAEGAVS